MGGAILSRSVYARERRVVVSYKSKSPGGDSVCVALGVCECVVSRWRVRVCVPQSCVVLQRLAREREREREGDLEKLGSLE